MGNILTDTGVRTVVLEKTMLNRIFGLDGQLGFDALLLALAVFAMFFILSYLVFNPARDLLKRRQEKIEAEMAKAAKDMDAANMAKAQYEAKLAGAAGEVDEILSEGRKKALKRENEIIEEADAEAARIRERAKKEAELEKSRMQDEFKQEMISVATAMAGKMISGSMDAEKQAQLIDEALNEMGDDTWQR